MLNKIVIMGRLTRDPELRRTQNGVAVCTITLAVDRDFKQDGKTQVDFIDVVAWRQTAEFVSKYFAKGRMMVAEGSLQSRKWTDKNGQNRVSWEVQAERAYFGDSKREETSNTADDYDLPEGGGEYAEVEDDGELPF